MNSRPPSEKSGHHLITPRIEDNREVLDMLPFPVVMLSAEMRFLWINDAAETFFQRSRTLLVNTPLSAIFAEDNPLFTLTRKALHTQASVSDRQVALSSPKTGAKRADIHIIPLLKNAEKGAPNSDAVLITIYEMTHMRQFEDMEQLKGAALSMSKMTSLLSHEIKNPLAGIKGAAQLLQMELSDEALELSEMIVTEADRITSLLNRIDTFSVDAPLALEQVNIHEILDHTRRITSASFGRHLVIRTDYDPSLPLINADKELLIQCFVNLLKNASEATQAGDEIKIRTSYNLSRYRTSLSEQKRVFLPLQIEIEDSGAGISDEVAERLFEPFVSTKQDGSGLGLSMVASVLADHGGTIALKPVSKGSCFVVNLPLPAKENEQIPVSEKRRVGR